MEILLAKTKYISSKEITSEGYNYGVGVDPMSGDQSADWVLAKVERWITFGIEGTELT